MINSLYSTFPDRKGSLRTSLVNLFFWMDEKTIGDNVIKNYKYHPLVLPDYSACALLAPRIIADLSENKYEAQLAFNFNPDSEERVRGLIKEVEKAYGSRHQEIMGIIEKDAGLNKFSSFPQTSDFAYSTPSVLFILGEYNIPSIDKAIKLTARDIKSDKPITRFVLDLGHGNLMEDLCFFNDASIRDTIALKGVLQVKKREGSLPAFSNN